MIESPLLDELKAEMDAKENITQVPRCSFRARCRGVGAGAEGDRRTSALRSVCLSLAANLSQPRVVSQEALGGETGKTRGSAGWVSRSAKPPDAEKGDETRKTGPGDAGKTGPQLVCTEEEILAASQFSVRIFSVGKK